MFRVCVQMWWPSARFTFLCICIYAIHNADYYRYFNFSTLVKNPTKRPSKCSAKSNSDKMCDGTGGAYRFFVAISLLLNIHPSNCQPTDMTLE